MGRPSNFSPDLFATIMDRLAGGESLRAICRGNGMPDRSTVLRWIAGSTELQRTYALAVEARADELFDEVLEIADDARGDWTAKDGKAVLDGENVRRAALRIDARKWALARMAPKRYGEKLDLNHGVQDSLGDFLAALDGKTRGIPGQGAA